jgi:hypothetical protein
VTLSIVDKRHIDTGIHVKLFPEMLRDHDSKAENALALQGDHRKHLMRNRYVNDGAVIGHLVSVEQDDFIRTSRVFQALYHTGPVDPNWPPSILHSCAFDRVKHEKDADNLAAALVPEFYGFDKLGKDGTQREIHRIYSQLTFLFTLVSAINIHVLC